MEVGDETEVPPLVKELLATNKWWKKDGSFSLRGWPLMNWHDVVKTNIPGFRVAQIVLDRFVKTKTECWEGREVGDMVGGGYDPNTLYNFSKNLFLKCWTIWATKKMQIKTTLRLSLPQSKWLR